VANLCSQCGSPLPREDSRFCNRCGAVISANAGPSPTPRRTQDFSGERSSPGSGAENAGTRPAMREQIAFAPSFPGRSRLPQRAAQKHEVEDLPTVHMPSTPAAGKDGISSLPGRPFPAQPYRQAGPSQMPPGQFINQRQQAFPSQVTPHQAPVRQQPVTPAMPPSHPGFQQAIPATAPVAGGIGAEPSLARPAWRKSKMPLVVVLVMLLVLLISGLAYWMIAYQPFSVAAVTRTSLSFRNANLGIALQYPQGWTTQLDSAHQTVSFFDASHIDHVIISVTARNGSTASTYLNKEVAQLGLTEQQNLSPVTFAGTTWQQVQGNVLVSGATFTERLLVAQHGNRLYTMVFSAVVQTTPTPGPVVTYAAADHLYFSVFRASFQFLN
jgi:hypothetical protein